MKSPEKNIISLQNAEVLKNLKICLLNSLINTFNRYDSKRKGKKLLQIGLGKVTKIPNSSESKVNQAEKLQRKSIDKLKEIASFRKIKNRDKL